MGDLPDYRREIVIVESVELDITGSATVDLIKVGGVAIATPTEAGCVPISIENDAIAYDGVNDRFKIDIEKWSATDTVDVDIQNATIAVTQSGSWTVSVSGTVTVTGTVAATQSGTWTIQGTVTANAGTNLNTSALALEAGGNLAALVAKDFATQTTLAALNTKVPSDPAKESGKLTTIDTSLTALKAALGSIATDTLRVVSV